jgi:endonuclease G
MARQKTFFDQLTPNQRLALVAAILVVIGFVALVQWWQERRAQQQQPPPEAPGQPGQLLANRNVRFGMPAPAQADPASKDAYLIERPQYVLSYSDSKRTANWVCWNVNKGDLGPTKRAAGFSPDPDLPAPFHRIKNEDYNGSGFDRGHMCPSADRTDSEENNRATFYTTNIVPQSPQCNQHGWERFEHHCRNLTRNGSELYVSAGPFGQGGTGRDGDRQTIGRPQVVVPSAVWKVVMVLPNKDALPTQTTRTLAVWMPNDMTVTDDWKQYAVSVSDVENRTGFKFFPLVPDDVAGAIKGQVNRGE